MKVYIDESLRKLIEDELNIANEKNRKSKIVDNNFLILTKNKDKINITLKENHKKVGSIDCVMPYDIPFSYKNEFMSVINPKTGELTIITNVRLHGHTGYSLLDGTIKVNQLVNKTEYACSITDHGVMYGVIEFYKAMKEQHKKPIIGFEAYTEDYKTGEQSKRHLILIAKNDKGYENLVKLCSLGQQNVGGSFPYKPIIKYEWLKKYHKGIICTSACMGGEIPKAIRKNDLDLAYEIATNYKNIFGKDFYIEIQRHYMDNEKEINDALIKIAHDLDIKLIATDDAHYLNADDNKVHEVHLCNQVKKTMSDPKRFKFEGRDYFVHTTEQMEEKFNDIPEALYNTLEIMDKCTFDVKFTHNIEDYHLPKYPIPEGFTDISYFDKIVHDGFAKRFPVGTINNTSKEYKDRLEYELDVIKKMGYCAYFLIVWDFINYAKTHGCPVGPGRGSACGSLVAYCIEITNINPIPYNLLFERFLNPDRKSMPDIDTDFSNLLREDVINYCRRLYGEEAVSRIITFGTLSAKAVVKDVARIVYDEEEDKKLGDMISKTIPNAPKMTLKKAMDESPEFKNLYDTNKKVKEIIDIAFRLEGLPKNTSQHACGIIISNGAVTQYCPQVFLKNKDTGLLEGTTQYTMTECEEIGLLKMDFLGLKTMAILQESVDDINKIYGLNMTIDDIPRDDPAVYSHIAKGYTKGVFQLESPGMTAFMVKLFQDVSKKISDIEHEVLSNIPSTVNLPKSVGLSNLDKAIKELHDNNKTLSKAEFDKYEELLKKLAEFGNVLYERLIAGISLYRPGPISEIPTYIDGMLNPTHISYLAPQLESILNVTYGVLVYQEQVMTTVRELAGFTKGQADIIRKAMSKKKREILNEYKAFFVNGSGDAIDSHTGEPYNIEGCEHFGITKAQADAIWDKMDAFAEYAFNKSHAAGYADIGSKTGWISLYHPIIFMKANLNIFINNPDKMKPYLAYCYKEGIKMLTPCVNESNEFFSVTGKEESIRFGLKGIRNVKSASDLILAERNARGIFDSYQDFVERMVTYQKMSSRTIESLVYAGALDSFPGTRRAKNSIIQRLLDVAKLNKKAVSSGQITMFDLAKEQGLDDLMEIKKIPTPDIGEYNKDFKLAQEREYAGFYITGHPLDDYEDVLKNRNVIDISNLIDISEEDDDDDSRIETLSKEDDEEDVELFSSEVKEENYIGKTINVAGIIKELTNRYDRNGKIFTTFSVEDRTGSLGCVCFSYKRQKNEDKLLEGKKVLITGEFDVNDFGPQISVSTVIDLQNDIEFATSITVTSNTNVETARNQWKTLKGFVKKQEGTTKIKFEKCNNKSAKCEKEVFDFPLGVNLTYENLIKLQRIFGEENCKIS